MPERDGLHECHWPHCTQRVPAQLWGCKTHWYRLPRDLRNRLNYAYRHGSIAEHADALDAVADYIEFSEAGLPDA